MAGERGKRRAIWLLAGMMAAGMMLAVGCSPHAAETSNAGTQASAESTSSTSSTATTSSETPRVRTLADGNEVQLTPSWTNSKDYTDTTYISGISEKNYNLDVLQADERGCGACHDDLWDTIAAYDSTHLGAAKHLHVTSDVQQCIDCHSDDNFGWTPALSTMIHGLHGVNTDSEKAGCFQCHDVDTDTGELVLWDQVKHKRFQGITQVAAPVGSFTFNQDETTDESELFNINWMYTNYDEMRWENQASGTALDEDVFNNWTITVTGDVNSEKTWTLSELIANAPSETRTMKMHCEINPLGGPFIGQAEVTGIPLDWLIEQAGLGSSAVGMTWQTPDGETVHDVFKDVALSDLEGHGALLVYEINGERLSWVDGYPCQIWLGSIPSSRYTKQVSKIILTDEVNYETTAGNGRIMDGAANIGLTNTDEGQIIKAGEPYTFEGYADGWTKQVVAVEFSMDNGFTWTHCDTPNTDVDRWVRWSFTWTPPAGSDTAYVLQMRSVLADGTVSETPLEVMVNAKTEA